MQAFTAGGGVAYVHVGTHKTGTTSIQWMLSANAAAFRNAGLYVPRTGSIDPAFLAHHNVAWELGNNPQFADQRGTLDGLLRELAEVDARSVCLSSEEFEFLHLDGTAMVSLRDGLRSAGYEPKIVVYLRPQADYVESLYAELCPVWDVDYTDFLDGILNAGIYGCSRFDYHVLVDAFAEVFGRKNTIVRAYPSSVPPNALLHEFARIIAPAIDCDALVLPAPLNRRAHVPDVIAARQRHLGGRGNAGALPRERFDPLSLFEIIRICARFAYGNQRLKSDYGITVAGVSFERLAREVIAELTRDRECIERKRAIRTLIRRESFVTV